MDAMMVITTVDDGEKAREIARHLIENHLAACVQISGPVRSYYFWKGELQEDEEWQIFIKTTPERYDDLEKRIREIHPYELPEIIAFRTAGGLDEYIQWVHDQCSGIS